MGPSARLLTLRATLTPYSSPHQDRLDEGMARSIFESERQLADMAVRARPEA